MPFPIAYPLLLLAAWIAAWLVDLQLRGWFQWGTDADTVFWMGAKLAIWVLPALIFVKRRKREAVADYFSLRSPAHGLGLGLLIGLAVLAVSFLLDFLLGGASFNLPVMDITLISTALVTPFAEEWALRGFYMRGLVERGFPANQANSYAAYAFVVMHVPGWYFQGRLREPFGLLQPAIFLWLFGLVLGWSKGAGSKEKTGSLYTPIVVHALNNLYVAGRG